MESFVALANQLAVTSAEIIRTHFQTKLAVDHKSDGTVVTIADRATEAAMRELIGRTFPDHGIRGEELEDTQTNAEYQWIIDPIDGTENFVTGSFLFGTLIGLLLEGKPILGVISHPLTNTVLIGYNNKTYLNGHIVTVREYRDLQDASLFSTGHWEVGHHRNMQAYDDLTKRVRVYRTWGDCHGYYLVAAGFGDIMIDAKLKPWDILPVIPIIEGAGGRITDWDGNDILTTRGENGAIATSGKIHDEVIRLLAG